MSSRFEDLDPMCEPVCRQIILDAQERIAEEFPGSVIRPSVTFRLLSEQLAAKAAGLSDLNIGMHNFGRAMDVAVIGPNGDYILDGQDRRYTIFGQVAKQHGWIWGGDWTNRPSGKPPDYDHCEARMAGTPMQLGAWLDAHKVVTA